MNERLISYQFHRLDWFIWVRFDHTFPCCIFVKDVNIFNQCRKFLPRISSSHTSGNRLALNNGSTYKYNNDKQMKDGKLIYSLHIHVDVFTVRFHPTRPCCKDLRQVAKFRDRVNHVLLKICKELQLLESCKHLRLCVSVMRCLKLWISRHYSS